MNCESCGTPMDRTVRPGRTPRYCSDKCRQRASRARRKNRGIPDEMVRARRWVRADRKRPIMPDGSPASSTDPSTWSTFQDVQQGAGDGFGFMCGGGFGVIDLDDCVDSAGGVSELAQSVLGLNLGAFVERSVSGRGLHVWGRLPEQPGSRRAGAEVYSRARFIRMGEMFRAGGLFDLVL